MHITYWVGQLHVLLKGTQPFVPLIAPWWLLPKRSKYATMVVFFSILLNTFQVKLIFNFPVDENQWDETSWWKLLISLVHVSQVLLHQLWFPKDLQDSSTLILVVASDQLDRIFWNRGLLFIIYSTCKVVTNFLPRVCITFSAF